MADKGLYVQCHAWAPKQQSKPHTVSRVMCLSMTEDYCPKCPHSAFVLHIQQEVGGQTVACPRWGKGRSRHKGDAPSDYVLLPRETCLTTRPFEYCPSCPNSQKDLTPFTEPGWCGSRKRGKNEQPRSASDRGAKQNGAPSNPF